MILSDRSIRKYGIITPWCPRTVINGMSYGQGPASYDVRINQDIVLAPGDFKLASTVEHFDMPDDIAAQVKDKSSWARHGLSVFNTFIDPGWHGFLTLELKNLGNRHLMMKRGDPIAQIVFSILDHSTSIPYNGKYQDQANHPVFAIEEA